MIKNSPKNTKQFKPKTDIRSSKANYKFDVYADVWQLDANKSINLELLRPLGLNSNFEDNFKLVLGDYACEFSASYIVNIFIYTRKLLATGVKKTINEQHVINLKASLTKSTEYKLGYIRAFLLDWYDKGLKGVDKKAVELLGSTKFSGCEKGKAVAIGCPHSGAYNFDEQVAFINWYIDAYTSNQISLQDYAYIMTLQQTGARTVQLCYLYAGDLVTRIEHGMEHYDLKLPNAKQQNEAIREGFRTKADIGEDLALVLKAQAKKSYETVEAHFKVTLTDEQKARVPIFLNKYEVLKLTTLSEFFNLITVKPDFLCMRLTGRESAMGITRRISHLCPLKTDRIKLDGENGDLHINARRFRYTHATNMAMNGASNHIIAEELGHSDTQQVGVYTEFNEEMAERIDDALASSLVPLAQAFSGTLIDSEKDAIRANDPRSLINNDEGKSLGNCGEFGFCANGTIHCYTCSKFQPWINAPHKQVLDSILSERDRKKKMGASEFVLQGQNRTIDAIKIVVQKCDARKIELEKEGAIDV
jgi:hypothetical protein